jgi:hypothetical protein
VRAAANFDDLTTSLEDLHNVVGPEDGVVAREHIWFVISPPTHMWTAVAG